MRTRIASSEMLPDGDLLPHLICSPPVFSGGVSMRRVSMATRDELVVVLRERYARSARAERGRYYGGV